MYKDKKFLAVIPARGSSKRLPRKNILDCAGKPLIAWTIEAANKSKYIDEIILSTDCDEVSSVALNYDVNIPFKRPKFLSDDTATSSDVLIHAVEEMKKSKKEFDYVLLLQPTSPLRDNFDIDNAIEFLFQKDANLVLGVSKLKHPIQWSNTVPKSLSMENFISKIGDIKRSQDYEPNYIINGAIYIIRVSVLLRTKQLMIKEKSFAFMMDYKKSIDIDDLDDFEMAEFYLNE